MKYVAVVLFAWVAVSQAAFTSNLVKQAQPALVEAMFKVRLAAFSTRADGDMQTDLVATLQQHAQDLLDQIQSYVDAGQEIAGNVVAEFQSTYEQLIALGSNIVSNGQGILSNFVSNILGFFFGNRLGLGQMVSFVQNSNLNSILQSVFDYATGLVNQLDLVNLIPNALHTILPSNIAQLVINALNLYGQNRGIFSDAWNAINDAGSAAVSHITDLATNIYNVASVAFSNVQQIALNFISEATSNASAITSQAAIQFLDFLRPYQQDLGVLYDQVVAQISQIIG